ncbi:MAG: glycosyltransferase family 4 protein [bacterium]|nr:glycosyltransferase family 4 protein [bacterium]
MPNPETKIKIMYVITKSNWGGAQRYVYELATSLPPEKFDVSVAAGGQGLLREKLAGAGIRVISIPALERDIDLIKEILSLFSLAKIFRQERPDIVHLSSSKAGGLGAFAARGLSIFGIKPKVIFTVHGWAFNEDRNFAARALIYFLQWLTVFLSDKVILISTHDYLRALQIPLLNKNRLVLIHNGLIAPSFFEAEYAKTYLSFLIKTTRPYEKSLWLITIAELTKNKGLEYLIEAASLFRQEKFFIIIIGEGEEREKLEARIKKLGLEKRIFLSGFIPEAARYLKAADIFLLPSVKEGLSYVIMEAMAASLPVIATTAGGIPDLVVPGETGILVKPKEPTALADALEKLSVDENLRKTFGARGKKIAVEKFSFEQMRKKTAELYLS